MECDFMMIKILQNYLMYYSPWEPCLTLQAVFNETEEFVLSVDEVKNEVTPAILYI